MINIILNCRLNIFYTENIFVYEIITIYDSKSLLVRGNISIYY